MEGQTFLALTRESYCKCRLFHRELPFTSSSSKRRSLKAWWIDHRGMRYIRQAYQEVIVKEFRALKDGRELPGWSKLLPLRLVLDCEGVLRRGGRPCYAEFLPWETCYPIILACSHWVTMLAVKHHHAGNNQVLVQLSVQCWTISARETIWKWERECMQCTICLTSLAKQIVARLSELHTQKSPWVFSHLSIDFNGPFVTKQGRGKTRQKRYLCLSSCLETRAMHLKESYSLDTDSYLNVFF